MIQRQISSQLGTGLVRLGDIMKATLLAHFPLPYMPFDTHKNIVFESGKSEKETRVEETHKAVDKKAYLYRHEAPYAYHPHHKNKQPEGLLVDFVVA